MTPSPPATVIVCVYNRPAPVVACLESLLRLDTPGVELLVVDDGSTDDTPARLRAFAAAHPGHPVRVVTHPGNRGVSAARNTGIRAARGDVLLFTDSDCLAEPGWVSAVLRAFEDPDVAAAYGVARDAPPRTWAELAYAVSPRVSEAGWRKRPLIGNNMAVRRAVAAELLFDPAMSYYCDEVDLARRLVASGRRIVHARDAVVRHDHPMTVRKYLALAYRQAQGSARFWYKHGLVGLDLLPLAAAVLTLPLGLVDTRLLAVPGAFALLQVAFAAYAEARYKGKSAGELAVVLPLVAAFYLVRGVGIAVTLARIMCGGEAPIRESKRAWRAARRSPPGTPPPSPPRTAPR